MCMGTRDEFATYDVIWCEVDQLHYLIPRSDSMSTDEYFEMLKRVAGGSASTLAGSGALGFGTLKKDIKKHIIDHNTYYNEVFLPALERNNHTMPIPQHIIDDVKKENEENKKRQIPSVPKEERSQLNEGLPEVDPTKVKKSNEGI